MKSKKKRISNRSIESKEEISSKGSLSKCSFICILHHMTKFRVGIKEHRRGTVFPMNMRECSESLMSTVGKFEDLGVKVNNHGYLDKRDDNAPDEYPSYAFILGELSEERQLPDLAPIFGVRCVWATVDRVEAVIKLPEEFDMLSRALELVL